MKTKEFKKGKRSMFHDGIESLELGSLDGSGTPVKERLASVEKAISIFNTLKHEDWKSSVSRARTDAMFDGEPPYSQAKLVETSQAHRTNLNYGEAQRLLDVALSSYVDLYSSLEKFAKFVPKKVGTQSSVSPDIEQDVDSVTYENIQIIEEEFTATLRNSPKFNTNYLMICTNFIKHGVAIAMFNNPESHEYTTYNFDDVLIPRSTEANEAMVDVAIIRRNYSLPELNAFIQNEKVAIKAGWNPKEIKRVIAKNVKTTKTSSTGYDNFQAIQAEIKNNDLASGVTNPNVEVLQFLVTEMDGRISHYICSLDSPEAFIFKGVGRYNRSDEAYIFFTFGVGTNGTYHSIRGLGQRIFSHIQTSNRLRCQLVDGAMLNSSVMLQPENQRALEDLDYAYYGGYSVLSPNVKVIERPVPNLTQSVIPALQDITQQLLSNTDSQSTYGSGQTSPYKNEMQVVSDMDVSSRLSGATLSLFYSAWSRLIKEIARRMLSGISKSPEVDDFFRRCELRGVSKKFITGFVDLDRTKAIRAIGAGSKVDRVTSLRQLQGMSGSFDEVGRNNLTRDLVTSLVGSDFADRYVPKQTQGRETVDDKVAILENNHLSNGQQIEVLSSEIHSKHLQAHMEALGQLLEALEGGQADPVQTMPSLQAFSEHISQHAQFAIQDPNNEPLVGQTNEMLNYAKEAINNTEKHIAAMQREQEQATQEGQPMEGEEGQNPAVDPNQAKMEAHQVDMRIKQEKAQLDRAIQKQKFEQDSAIRDAKAALDMRENASKNYKEGEGALAPDVLETPDANIPNDNTSTLY